MSPQWSSQPQPPRLTGPVLHSETWGPRWARAPEPEEEIIEGKLEEAEGEFVETTETPSPRRSIAKSVGRGLGRGLGRLGRGLGETVVGFGEAIGEELKPVSPRGIGKGLGRATISTGRLAKRGLYEVGSGLGRLQFREPSYFWGPGQAYTGVRPPRKPTSRLPVGIQTQIVKTLDYFYPDVYRKIWYERITQTEFIGTLRNHFPDVYQELLEHIRQEGASRPQVMREEQEFDIGFESP